MKTPLSIIFEHPVFIIFHRSHWFSSLNYWVTIYPIWTKIKIRRHNLLVAGREGKGTNMAKFPTIGGEKEGTAIPLEKVLSICASIV